MKLIGWFAVAGALAAACKSKDDNGGGGGAAAKSLPDELAKFLPANATDLVQGVWQTRVQFWEGEKAVALEIKGDAATANDGAADHPLTMSIQSPCTLRLTEKITTGKMAGGTSSDDKRFLVAGGKLVAVGHGAGGYRKGKEAIVCQIGPDGIVTMDATGACKAWQRDFMHEEKWEQKPTQCAWSTKDGKDVFTTGKPGDSWSHELVADGDLLWTDQLRDEAKHETYMKRATDLAAAKAWATEQNKPK